METCPNTRENAKAREVQEPKEEKSRHTPPFPRYAVVITRAQPPQSTLDVTVSVLR